MKKMSNIKLNNCWIYLFICLFMILPILSIDKTLIIATIFLIVLILLIKKFDVKKFPIWLFTFSLIIRIIVSILVNTQPESDFSVLLNASRSINIGDFSFNDTEHFLHWPYQIGFVFFQSLLLRICDSVLFLKIVNSIVTSGICLLIYYISREFMKEKTAQIVSIFYSLMIFPITYVTVLTNQHMSALLIYLGIYIIINSKSKLSNIKRYLIAGILISFGNIIRPEGIITIFSIILFLLLTINKKSIKETFKNILVLLGSYYIIFFIVSNLFIITNIGPYGLKNNTPYWKFVLGFNYETNGSWNTEDLKVIENKEESLNLIKERILANPIKNKLFINKIRNFWNKSTLSWSFNYIEDNNTLDRIKTLNSYNEKCLFIMYILIIIGLFNKIKNNKFDQRIILLVNQVFVTFGAYLLIEVQQRYAYFIQITTVILMGFGIEFLLDIFNNAKKLKKLEDKNNCEK